MNETAIRTDTSLPVPAFPIYTKSERRVDFGVHVSGLIFVAIGVPIILVMGLERANLPVAIGLPLYAVGLVMMISFSALYNIVERPDWKEILRRLDHSGIFLMIAGSYSPFALVKIGGPWGVGLFAFVWSCAILGVVAATVFPRRADRMIVILCLFMGWSIVFAINPLVHAVSTTTLVLLTVGGLTYTIGVFFHMAERLPYHNAVWHIFVLAAAGLHYAAVVNAIVINPPA
ncbi:MAG: hemolysin III family protein [Alphaproteobacteria bacterium]